MRFEVGRVLGIIGGVEKNSVFECSRKLRGRLRNLEMLVALDLANNHWFALNRGEGSAWAHLPSRERWSVLCCSTPSVCHLRDSVFGKTPLMRWAEKTIKNGQHWERLLAGPLR